MERKIAVRNSNTLQSLSSELCIANRQVSSLLGKSTQSLINVHMSAYSHTTLCMQHYLYSFLVSRKPGSPLQTADQVGSLVSLENLKVAMVVSHLPRANWVQTLHPNARTQSQWKFARLQMLECVELSDEIKMKSGEVVLLVCRLTLCEISNTQGDFV